MKKLLAIFTISLVWIMFGSISYAINMQPISTFSDWIGELSIGDNQSTYDPTYITPNGNSVDINITGNSADYIWTGLYLYQEDSPLNRVGMLATISISSINGNAQAGIVDSIGKVGNDRIQVYMYLQQWDNGQKGIRFRIRTRDLTTGTQKQLAAGVIGEWDGGWNLGDNITVGFMRTENDFWFYAEGYPGFVKWTHTGGTVEDFQWSPEVYGYTDPGTGNSVTANVSNVYIIN